MSERVRVAVRIRPVLEGEGGPPVVEADVEGRGLRITEGRRSDGSVGKGPGQVVGESEEIRFAFDRVFSCKEDSEAVYENHCRHVVEQACRGFHGTVFAYGQTGTGKTYTMGSIQRYAVRDIFKSIEESSDHQWLVRFSMVEIYNDMVTDVLSDNSKPLKLMDGRKMGAPGVVIEGLTHRVVSSEEDMLRIMQDAKQRLQVSATKLNRESSRSHSMMRIVIESQKKAFLKDRTNAQDRGGSQPIFLSCLNLVDLAGSERVSESKSEGQRLREVQHINSSLLALGNVINCLADGACHVPFRSSPLTRILEHSLGGNSYTSIICTVSPLAGFHLELTRSTIQFAMRAMKVTNKVTRNELQFDTDKELRAESLLRQYQQEIEDLRSQLQRADLHKREVKEKERRARNLGRFLLQGNAIDRAFNTPNKRHSADSYVKPTPTKSLNGRHSWVSEDTDGQIEREQSGDLVQFIKAFGKSQRETKDVLVRSKEEFEYLENIAATLQRKVSENQDTISRQKREIESLRAQLQIVDGHVTSREMQIRDLEEELEFRENALRESTELLRVIEEERQSDQTSAEEDLKSKDEEIQRLELEIKHAHDDLIQKDSMLVEFHAALAEVKCQLESEQLAALEGNATREDCIARLKEELASAVSKAEEQSLMLEEMEELVETTRGELETERSTVALNLGAHVVAEQAAQVQQDELAAKLLQYEEILQESKNQHAMAIATMEEDASNEIESLKKQNNDLIAELHKQESKHAAEVEKWIATEASFASEKTVAAKDMAALEQEMDLLKVQTAKLEEQLREIEEQNVKVRQELSTEQESALAGFCSRDREIRVLQDLNKELGEKLQSHELRLEESSELLQKCKEELESERKASQAGFLGRDESITRLNEELASTRCELQESETRMVQLQEEHRAALGAAEQLAQNLEQEVVQSQEHASKLLENLNMTEQMLKETTSKLQAAEQAHEASQQAAAEGFESRDTEIANAQVLLQRLQDDLHQRESELETLRSDLEEAGIELEESKCHSQVLQKQLEISQQNERTKDDQLFVTERKLQEAHEQSEMLHARMQNEDEATKHRIAELESLIECLLNEKHELEKSQQDLIAGRLKADGEIENELSTIMSSMQVHIGDLGQLSSSNCHRSKPTGTSQEDLPIHMMKTSELLSALLVRLQAGLSGVIVSASKREGLEKELERLQVTAADLGAELSEMKGVHECTLKSKDEVFDRNEKLQRHVEALQRRLKDMEQEYAEARQEAETQLRSCENRMVAAESALNDQTILLENLRKKSGRQGVDDEGWESGTFDPSASSKKPDCPLVATLFDEENTSKIPDSRTMEKILRLWDELCVPLYHRSRFYGGIAGVHGLRFKEECCQLELNRLNWLKERFYGSSEEHSTSMLRIAAAGLMQERQELLKQLRNLSRRTKNLIFAGWGIDVNSKNRKSILMGMLWTIEGKIQQSASLVLFLADKGHSPDIEPAGLFFRSQYAMASLGAAMESTPGGLSFFN